MNYEKYVDKLANINVLGRLAKNPSLLEEVDKYKINNKRISVTGFSSSGSYVFNLVVNNQNYFSAILALSSGISANSPTIQNNLSYL